MHTEVRHRREPITMLPFARDERASLPRPLARFLSPQSSLAGVPAALRDRIGRNLVSTAFPYGRAIQTDGKMAQVELELVELENLFWLVVICPSLGGRILRVFDRRRERELLLTPPALLQGVVGLAGAWFIGGVEFNAFRWGHNIHGGSAVETRRLRLPDGVDAVEFGACDELLGCEWRVRVALGEAQVLCRVELTNHSRQPQPDYWWTTIAVPAHRSIRVMGAPGPVLHHGMFRTGYQHDQWPRLHGRDWSRWVEHHEVASAYLHGNGSDFFGSLDERDGFAFVHQADHAVCRGRKLWTVGAGRGDMFSDRLLETSALSYLELQSGLNPMQVEAGLLAPGERRAWTESIGAIELPPGDDEESYPALFARYAQAATSALRAEYAARSKSLAMDPTEEELLVAAAPRVALSARIVQRSATVDAAQVAKTVAQGWVGGEAWREKLAALRRSGELTTDGKLALAAANLDVGETETAVDELREVAGDESATGGWAAYLLGLQTGERAALERATRLLPQRAETWIALDAFLARHRLHADREKLWADAPVALLARDDVRVSRAAGALARGEWGRVRELLAAPLITIPEGAPTPWLVYRESFVGEALARWREDDVEAAMALLFEGGRPAPQFGMGRDEPGWGHDLLYYRWRLASMRGRTLEAALLLEQAMWEEPYAGSLSAAYLARLAREAGHPSAAKRLDQLRNWAREAGAGASDFVPLRAAVIEGLEERMDGWEQLRADPLYCHRAGFELEVTIQPGSV